MGAIQRILVATDFSACSRAAADLAADYARRLGARLTVLHVWRMSPMVATATQVALADLVGPIESATRAELAAEVARLGAKLPTVESELRNGAVWEEILDFARGGKADLIVLGTHGRSGLAHALMGSVAERVVRMSPVPVLTVREAKA
jgi:nucleotide-binding universal stress UspA family protein